MCSRYYRLENRREESQGGVRQWRECKHRNNGVRESTSEKVEKSNQSIHLGVYQLCMASILLLGKERREIGGCVCVCFYCVSMSYDCVFVYIADN